jgi:hypothetical protein
MGVFKKKIQLSYVRSHFSPIIYPLHSAGDEKRIGKWDEGKEKLCEDPEENNIPVRESKINTVIKLPFAIKAKGG